MRETDRDRDLLRPLRAALPHRWGSEASGREIAERHRLGILGQHGDCHRARVFLRGLLVCGNGGTLTAESSLRVEDSRVEPEAPHYVAAVGSGIHSWRIIIAPANNNTAPTILQRLMGMRGTSNHPK